MAARGLNSPTSAMGHYFQGDDYTLTSPKTPAANYSLPMSALHVERPKLLQTAGPGTSRLKEAIQKRNLTFASTPGNSVGGITPNPRGIVPPFTPGTGTLRPIHTNIMIND